MEFKYIGQLPMKDLDLALHGIVGPNQVIIKGFTFEVPDKEVDLINRLKLCGDYQEIQKIGKAKKIKKEKED